MLQSNGFYRKHNTFVITDQFIAVSSVLNFEIIKCIYLFSV